MTNALERAALTDQFLGLAGRIERLRHTDPNATTLDKERLVLWQKLFDDNATTVLGNRMVLLEKPATVSVETLVQWVKYARKTLTQTPLDGEL